MDIFEKKSTYLYGDEKKEEHREIKTREPEVKTQQDQVEQQENMQGRPDAEQPAFQNPANYPDIGPSRPVAEQPPKPEPHFEADYGCEN